MRVYSEIPLGMHGGAGLAGMLALAAGPFAAGDARAQPADPSAAAESLFREGRREAVAGHHAEACDKFRASERLDPSTGTLLNLGDCD